MWVTAALSLWQPALLQTDGMSSLLLLLKATPYAAAAFLIYVLMNEVRELSAPLNEVRELSAPLNEVCELNLAPH
jgi:hypothetical protein